MHLPSEEPTGPVSLKPLSALARAPRWLMVVDLRKCNGCQCCVANCGQTNELGLEAPWRRVVNWEVADQITPRRIFLPLSCMHCANPPCLEVCPTGATFQRADG